MTITPAPRVSATAPAVSRTAAPVGAAVDADSPVSREAAALVRRYVNAVAHGDEVTAYAALGGAPGDKGLALSEEEFLNPAARIISIRARQRGEASATVEVEFQTPKGAYYGTYQVAPGARGLVIEEHDFIKP